MEPSGTEFTECLRRLLEGGDINDRLRRKPSLSAQELGELERAALLVMEAHLDFLHTKSEWKLLKNDKFIDIALNPVREALGRSKVRPKGHDGFQRVLDDIQRIKEQSKKNEVKKPGGEVRQVVPVRKKKGTDFPGRIEDTRKSKKAKEQIESPEKDKTSFKFSFKDIKWKRILKITAAAVGLSFLFYLILPVNTFTLLRVC